MGSSATYTYRFQPCSSAVEEADDAVEPVEGEVVVAAADVLCEGGAGEQTAVARLPGRLETQKHQPAAVVVGADF